MPLIRRVIALVLCALLSACATSDLTRQSRSEIDRILDRQRQELHIPGAALAIVKDDRVVYVATVGLRDVERQLPVTQDTVFPIGSCTKAFTSMAIALAADRGLLSLDDHPRKFLPYFRMADPQADAQVTLRDMLGHRTGLRGYADLAAEPGVLNREEYVRAATAAKPEVPFRSAFQYSNAMYSAAGEIAGKVNGTTWERAVETTIFAPLGMNESVTDLQRALTLKDHATGYDYDEKTKSFRGVPPPRGMQALAPGGAVASSIRDMTRWLRMLAAGGKGFVSERMFRELTSPGIAINPRLSYALGWATYDWNGMRVVEHNGGSGGISALVSFIPERHAGFVFLANISPTSMTKVGTAGAMLWPLILNESSRSAPPPPPPHATANAETTQGKAASIDADTLLARMIDAAGGAAAMRRHTSLEVHARKSYENHGVVAELTVQAQAPAMRNEVEEWSAAGKHIAHLRVWFDGAKGAQETSFGQDSVNDVAANEKARRDDALHPLLELKQLYPTLSVEDADDAWVLLLGDTRLFVSKQSYLVVQRAASGETSTFEDYRDVDGERIPFRTVIKDALGETTIDVTSAAFNVVIPPAAFKAQSDRAASSAAAAPGSSR